MHIVKSLFIRILYDVILKKIEDIKRLSVSFLHAEETTSQHEDVLATFETLS